MLTVVKIGGNVIDDSERLKAFLDDFVRLEGDKILVHGGGKMATAMATRLGVETHMIDGRRVTSPEMLDIAVMIYAGLINKKIVAGLEARGCHALGLSGADGGLIRSVRRPRQPIDYGEVGNIIRVNHEGITHLLKGGFSPVFSAITCDLEGNLLNTNADTVASEIAVAMSSSEKVRLIFCLEKNGVLRDVEDAESTIPLITPAIYKELFEAGTVSDGMIPKITNAFQAIARGVYEVEIKSSDSFASKTGTVIKHE